MISIAWGPVNLFRLAIDGEMALVIGSEFQLRENRKTFDGVISKQLTDAYSFNEYMQIADVFGIEKIAPYAADSPVLIAALNDTEQGDLEPLAKEILDLYRIFLGRARANDTTADQT